MSEISSLEIASANNEQEQIPLKEKKGSGELRLDDDSLSSKSL
tara:strand:+ start:234 stop:362 length:129 start_codon:yes stop_codon:yes gene_type:complete